MTDTELLVAAARAAGIADGDVLYDMERDKAWNPLTDDGDALRLAVKLGMKVLPYPKFSPEKHSVEVTRLTPAPPEDDENTFIGPLLVETYKCDPYAATRRAIVRAAAEIGSGGHNAMCTAKPAT